ncbi:MAG: hypothetical protein J2P17_04185 [Mycobacterium sp.]|nr:hypothetical protein [Mycobacterium sp.]
MAIGDGEVVLYAIGEASNAGFRVDDDLSVIDKCISHNAGQRAARRAQAQRFAADIRARAEELAALDQEVAADITNAAGNVGNPPFGKSGEGHIQAVDNKVHPRDDPFNEHIEPPPYKAPDGKEWHWYVNGKGWQLEDPLKTCDGLPSIVTSRAQLPESYWRR